MNFIRVCVKYVFLTARSHFQIWQQFLFWSNITYSLCSSHRVCNLSDYSSQTLIFIDCLQNCSLGFFEKMGYRWWLSQLGSLRTQPLLSVYLKVSLKCHQQTPQPMIAPPASGVEAAGTVSVLLALLTCRPTRSSEHERTEGSAYHWETGANWKCGENSAYHFDFLRVL